jgi:hypothetical protein
MSTEKTNSPCKHATMLMSWVSVFLIGVLLSSSLVSGEQSTSTKQAGKPFRRPRFGFDAIVDRFVPPLEHPGSASCEERSIPIQYISKVSVHIYECVSHSRYAFT